MVSVLLLAAALAAQIGPGDELVVNGDFEQGRPDGKTPTAWTLHGDASWAASGQNHFIRIRDDGQAVQTIELDPRWWKIEVSVRVRCRKVQRGPRGWHDARVAMTFLDEAGRRVGPWPDVLHWTGTFDWQRFSRSFVIPQGARTLSIACAMYSASGVADFDDLSVRLVAFRPKPQDAPPPAPIQVLWGLDRAARWQSATRGRICINGLWQFYPGPGNRQHPPAFGTGWGWIKVPGSWAPGSGIEPIGPAIWQARDNFGPAAVLQAWYRRRVLVPPQWAGRRISLFIDNPVRSTTVFVNGVRVGRVDWPDGSVDITHAVVPGEEAEIAIFADALPIAPSQWAAKSPEERQRLTRQTRLRGLCGDVYLDSGPAGPGPRFDDVLLMPSVRKKALGVRFALPGARASAYLLDAEARGEDGKVARRWSGVKVTPDMAVGGRIVVWLPWPNPRLWDLRRPYFYTLTLRLRDADGSLLDETLPIRFGFREFWVQGRQAFLNGHPVHIRAFDCLNTASDGGLASETACRWTLQRFAQVGMNFVYLGHYRLDWGQVRYLQGIVEAADKLGMLVALCMPHPAVFEKDFDPATGQPEPKYWQTMARWVARQAGNHPCVVMYAMSHNYLGHPGDQNPQFLDASLPEFDGRLPEYLRRKRKVARWAERYVNALDPTRVVYHHQAGNFGPWYTINCYLNWVPIQERIEWLSRYFHAGRKPLFLVEFGMPHRASFQRHRGAPFIWRNEVHAEPLCIEYAAMLFGDRAYRLTSENIEQYDRMARVYEKKGPKFYFWEVFPRSLDHGHLDVVAEYTRYTWPAFRTWELAAVGPWDWNDCGRVQSRRVALKTDWTDLQRPGFKPDFIEVKQWYHQPPDQPVQWTPYGRALLRYNQDLLAYIAGRPEKFASRDHIFAPGETVRKQIVLINDTARPQVFSCRWRATVGGRAAARGRFRKTVEPGRVAKVPISFRVPAVRRHVQGALLLEGSAADRSGDFLRDRLSFDVLPPVRPPAPAHQIVVIDPVGLTWQRLRQMGVRNAKLLADPGQPPKPLPRAVIVGREALIADELDLWASRPQTAAEQGLPPLDRLKATRRLRALPAWVADVLRAGGRVLVCEQTERVLSATFGFRAVAVGVRRAFVRCPWHRAMRGMTDALITRWRGASTLTVPRTLAGPVGTPRIDWLGFDNTRVWKWGNYAQVASAVIEKPHRGDFLALADCGFDLAYSPLLDCRAGAGRVMFCQFDISHRTEDEPAARRLWANLLAWLDAADEPAADPRPTGYVGNQVGRRALAAAGVVISDRVSPQTLRAGDLLIVGPGGGQKLAAAPRQVSAALRAGAIVLCLAARPDDLRGWLPAPVTLKGRDVICTPIERTDNWLLRGLGPSELHWRGRLRIWAVSSTPPGSITTPTGLIAAIPVGRGWVVFCQVLPEMFDADNPRRMYFRLSRQRCAQMLARLLANCKASFQTPVLDNLTTPPAFRADLLRGRWLVKPDREGVGERQRWFAPDLDDSTWTPLAMPGFFDQTVPGLRGYIGDAWLRCHFTVGRLPRTDDLTLVISAVDDEDWTYLNGHFLGHVGRDTNPDDYWAAERRYRVKRQWLRVGDNVLAIRVRNLRGAGGIRTGPVAITAPPKWLSSYYIDQPQATDDPYRYCRW